uniref:Reverse transcriptase domain-containing protein n=1 Tax=Oreochromis niloticus TaxID=8128 RepID=A0A669DTM0_ORENI
MFYRFVLVLVVFLSFFLFFSPVSGDPEQGSFVYSRDQLLALRPAAVLPADRLDIPSELRKKRRGCRAGKERRRPRRRRYRPSLPSVIIGNVRSLPNKMDELTSLTWSQREYRQCSIMMLTESWLTPLTPDTSVTLPGFQMLRADRTRESGKRKGGGLAVFVNDRWCNPGHITVKEQLCSRDIELLAVSMRPYYLPREFSHVIAITAYVPPSANADAACDSLHSVVSRLQTQSPRALLIISGDFNHASLDSTLPTFTQYVTCPTRDNKTLDLLYANAEEAYSSSPLPPLGRSDHNLVHLVPVYEPLVRREPPATRTVQRWSEESEEALKDCFESTVWEVICDDHGEDIDSLTTCITDYINFCVDNTVPTRTVRCFSNNKPWITSEIKAVLKQKRRAFKSRDKEELKRVQRELRGLIRNGKDSYRQKMENQLQQNNVGEVWRGLRTISGHKHQNSLPGRDVRWANELNHFFNRFDSAMRQSPTSAADSPTPTAAVPPLTPQTLHTSSIHPAHSSPPPTTASNTHSTQGSSLSLSTTQVRRELRRIKAKKAAGPDGISSRVVRSCADQLCGVMEHLFNLSLRLGRVPQLWKTSCVVPVPKTSRPKDLNSYRPVALTSHLMKTLERLVLAQLRRLVSSSLDPLQFAYQPGIGADDAIIHLLHRSLAHLETAGSTVRIMFFDFSSAFNTILPSVLKDKLENSGVDHHLTTWILDYLTDRPQYVRTQGCVSDRVVCSTGAPQGTVLAPFLFTIYTADFSHNSTQCFLQKFSDDSAIVGLITDGDDKEYRGLTQDFVDWCQLNYLQINASKTKELVVDFRRHKHPPLQPLNIQGMDIEAVDSYRYLGVHLNNKLDWTHNSDALYRKGQSRLYLLRRLRSFGVEGPLLKTFYDSVVASAIFYGVVCWGAASLLGTGRD